MESAEMNDMMSGLLNGPKKQSDSSEEGMYMNRMGGHHHMRGHGRMHEREMNPLYQYALGEKSEEKVGNKDANGNDILEVRMSFPTIRKGDHGETVIDFGPNMRLNYKIDNQERTGTLESARAFEPSPPIDRDPSMAMDPDASWLACLARRARRLSSITRWLVCLALMLCCLCMIWICLSIMKTAPKRRVMYAKGGNLKVSHITGTGEKKFLMDCSFTQPPDVIGKII